jgi:hypothetical protein
VTAAASFAVTAARLRIAFAEGMPLRAHAWLSFLFVVGRVLLYRAGLRMDFGLNWMWLADPVDLEERLLHTLFYFHAMPPGMNVLTGICLKLGGAHAASLATILFAGFSLVLVNALFYLGRALGLVSALAFVLALTFGFSPPTLFFDHLYLYESPVACLLVLSTALFLHAQRGSSFGRWLAFFLLCAVMGFVRSTFHLVWLGAVVALACYLSERAARRVVLKAAVAPALLLFALYAKNWAVFGVFGAFSEAPLNFNLVTTHELPPALRSAWMAEGKLSRFAAVDVFSGPRAYLPFFPSTENPAYPPELSRLERPSTGAPNYNHWFFLAAMPERRHDAWVCVRERPLAYLRTIATGFVELFSPTTRWYPSERFHGPSPHDPHRAVLGGYETGFNAVFHSFPFPPVGLYVLLPLVLVGAGMRARALRRGSDLAQRARGACFWLALFQIGYVITASTLFSLKESARYRYQIEPLLWVLAALALSDAVRRYAVRAKRERL